VSSLFVGFGLGLFVAAENVLRRRDRADRRRIGPRLLAAIDIGAGAGILGFGAYLGYRIARS
jgi:hypothetical protein